MEPTVIQGTSLSSQLQPDLKEHYSAHTFCFFIIEVEAWQPSDIYSASCLSKNTAKMPEGMGKYRRNTSFNKQQAGDSLVKR